MQKLGFVHHVEIADVMSGMELHPKFVEAVENLFTEIPIAMTFQFTDGCEAVMYPNDKAQPAEEAEVEFLEGCETYAYDVMTQLAKSLPVEILILHGNELVKLKMELQEYFEKYTEGDGNDKAFEMASDYAQERKEGAWDE